MDILMSLNTWIIIGILLSLAEIFIPGGILLNLAIAHATGDSIAKIADAIGQPGDKNALQMQLSEQYLQQMQGLDQKSRKIILPANILDVDNWQRLGSIASKHAYSPGAHYRANTFPLARTAETRLNTA